MPNCPVPADIDYLYPLPPRSRNRGRERFLHLRRLTEAVQPVTQAHQRMFPHHARSGVTHHDTDLFAAVALVAMHRTICARRFFLAETAALQPHAGVIQKLPTLRAQTFSRMMMVTAINPHHRRHCFPFPRQTRVRQIVSCFRCGLNHVRPGDQFSSHFHAVIFAQPVQWPLIQVNISRFISPHGKGA